MRNRIAAVALAALVVAGCDDAPTSTSTGDPQSKPAGASPAKPVLAYEGHLNYKGFLHRTVAVMNADGSNQTHLFGKYEARGQYFDFVSWSPSPGTSVCFVQHGVDNTAPDGVIKVIDVSVTGGGSVVGSTPRTVYTLPTGYAVTAGMDWSSTAAMGRIAYATYNNGNSRRTLWTVPAAGGVAPSVVWESDASYVKSDGSVIGHRQTLSNPTWNHNDQKLAVVRLDSAGTTTPYAVSTIMIFSTADNGSTWTYTDSIKVPGTTNISVQGLDWSRNANGVDKLLYFDDATDIVYYVDPTSGAVPTTNGVAGQFPVWSSDDSRILFIRDASATTYTMSTLVPFSTSVTDVLINPAYAFTAIKWN